MYQKLLWKDERTISELRFVAEDIFVVLLGPQITPEITSHACNSVLDRNGLGKASPLYVASFGRSGGGPDETGDTRCWQCTAWRHGVCVLPHSGFLPLQPSLRIAAAIFLL